MKLPYRRFALLLSAIVFFGSYSAGPWLGTVLSPAYQAGTTTASTAAPGLNTTLFEGAALVSPGPGHSIRSPRNANPDAKILVSTTRDGHLSIHDFTNALNCPHTLCHLSSRHAFLQLDLPPPPPVA